MESMEKRSPGRTLPVAVVGAGPVGLAAATHLLARGETPLILEAGAAVGASIRMWGHVRLFSPWRYLIDGAARTLLEATGWHAPDPDRLPTGLELVTEYLEPLAALPQLAPHIRLGTRVTAVTRHGFDKMKTPGRDGGPFEIRLSRADGGSEHVQARAVIYASGTYTHPNPLGSSGLPAIGEEAVQDQVFYGIPDVLGADRGRFSGRRVLVVGSGHSAFNVLLDLATLADQEPATRIVWAVRRPLTGADTLFGGEERDALPARGDLGRRMRRLVAGERVRLVSLRITALTRVDGRVVVHGQSADDGRDVTIGGFDEVVAATGFRPDLTLTGELRLDLDPGVEAPRALAPLIDPNVHSCGTVPPHGAAELQHPEHDYYAVGMKSYGRAPTFLLLTGYEQVRSVVSAIVGDVDGARSVELELPETGVCCDGTDEEESTAVVPLLGVGEVEHSVDGTEAHRPQAAAALCG